MIAYWRKMLRKLRNFWFPPSAPVFAVGDGVRIVAHPEEDFIGQVGTIVALASVDPEFDDDGNLIPDTGVHGPYKVDVRAFFSWAYCGGWDLEQLTASERLYYGV